MTKRLPAIAFFLATVAALPAAESLATIPLTVRAPVIDGVIDAKEWGGATTLQPLPRVSDGTIDDYGTRISIAWSPDILYMALQHSRPALAPMIDDPKGKDQLVLILTGPSGKKLKFRAWAGAACLEPDDRNAAPAWQQSGSADSRVWSLEVALPLNRLGTRKELLDSGAQLEVDLDEPSVGAESHRLTRRIRFIQRQLAFRFLDAGEFENGSHQGAMAELVNTDEDPVVVSVTMSVSPASGEPTSFTTQKLELPGDARRRIRLALPQTRGRFASAYDLTLNGSPFANGQFAFDGSGPMSVEMIPYFLWRGGVFVRSSLRAETNAVAYHCTIKEPRGDKPVVTSDMQGKGNEPTELFIDTSQLRPGPYRLTVTATREGAIVAERTLTFIRPEYPKWWKDRPR